MSKIDTLVLRFAAIALAVSAGAAIAQESNEEDTLIEETGKAPAADALAADDEYGPMDQTVPVAEEDPADELPSDAELTDETGPPQEPAMSPREELLYEFENYKRLMSEGVYDEADSVAKRIVSLAIQVAGPTSTETAKALTNLGIVQHRNKQFDAAQQNFESAIEIIEDNEDRLNLRLVNPLKGLGAAQLEGGRPDLAANTFNRAVHITHVNEGPHNMEQIEILESLAETTVRLGSVEDARDIHDKIYLLHQRKYEDDQLALVPSLMRRAEWQHRAGYITDEQATYRRAIRIIESNANKNDLRLIEPLTRLGHSYFFTDLHGETTLHHSPVSGEIYFKRALRIAENNPKSNWSIAADSKFALGDYYMMQGTQTRARKLYNELWEELSESEDRLSMRDKAFNRKSPLNERALPQYVGETQPANSPVDNPDYRQGSITVAFTISERGRVEDLQMVEANPQEFADMQRLVQREVKGRLYRPRYEDAKPVAVSDQVFTHQFYYTAEDLEEARGEMAPRNPEEEDS
jgi:tetratricopeptide (TPR) repeat protein